jgi:hypothetical protein
MNCVISHRLWSPQAQRGHTAGPLPPIDKTERKAAQQPFVSICLTLVLRLYWNRLSTG